MLLHSGTIRIERLLPLYLGVLTHNKTRKKELVDSLFEFVCPPKLQDEIFTTSAINNIDHNPSSFHGTGISIFQHPQNKTSGLSYMHLNVLSSDHYISEFFLEKLPQSYTDVPPVSTHT